MAQEFRSFLLFTAAKTSSHRDGELFQRYRSALTHSPHQWFRLRDADALVRFSIAAALACNELDQSFLTEEKLEVLAEIAVTLYDAVAFHKHRAEAEICSTFAYVPCQNRKRAYSLYNHVLWSLDVTAHQSPELRTVFNFIRPFGGPIHMMMHRYRFVEEDLTIGRPGDSEVIENARRNVKLWFRRKKCDRLAPSDHRYELVQSRRERLLFPGMAEMLERSSDGARFQYRKCSHFDSGKNRNDRTSRLCGCCENLWLEYIVSLPDRVVRAFPELKDNMTRLDWQDL